MGKGLGWLRRHRHAGGGRVFNKRRHRPQNCLAVPPVGALHSTGGEHSQPPQLPSTLPRDGGAQLAAAALDGDLAHRGGVVLGVQDPSVGSCTPSEPMPDSHSRPASQHRR